MLRRPAREKSPGQTLSKVVPKPRKLVENRAFEDGRKNRDDGSENILKKPKTRKNKITGAVSCQIVVWLLSCSVCRKLLLSHAQAAKYLCKKCTNCAKFVSGVCRAGWVTEFILLGEVWRFRGPCWKARARCYGGVSPSLACLSPCPTNLAKVSALRGFWGPHGRVDSGLQGALVGLKSETNTLWWV